MTFGPVKNHIRQEYLNIFNIPETILLQIIVNPYKHGDDIFYKGKIFSINDLNSICIRHTNDPLENSVITTLPCPPEIIEYYTGNFHDVTEIYINGAPGYAKKDHLSDNDFFDFLKSQNYKWCQEKTDLLELVVALIESGSFVTNGKKPKRTEAIKFISYLFNIDINNHEEMIRSACNRKKDTSPFLKRLSKTFDDYSKKEEKEKVKN